MGPNPVLGTNTGQAYIGREGEGIAPIFGPSRAADTYVTMRREQLAFERQTQAQQAAQAQAERKKAQEKLMTKPEYYVKYNDEVITALEGVRDKGAELIAAGYDPWSPSKNPEVKAFQKQWDEVQMIAQTSKAIEKYDDEVRKTLTAKGAADEYDTEGFVSEREAFLNRPLLEIAKDIDNLPSPKDRYGVVKATNQLSTYVKSITTSGETPTEQQMYDAAVAYAADPANERGIKALIGNDPSNVDALTQQASESGSKDLKVQAVLNTMKGMVKAPKDYLTFLNEQVKAIKVNTTAWGTDVKDVKRKADAVAKDIVANYPSIYTYKDVDGQPLVTGKNEAEIRANLEAKVSKDIQERLQIEKRDPLAVARFNKDNETKPGFTWEQLDQGVRQGEGKADSLLGGTKLPNGGTFEKVEFKPPSALWPQLGNKNGYEVTYYGKAWGEPTDDPEDDKIERRRTIFLNDEQWKELSFPLYTKVTSKKQGEAMEAPATIEEATQNGALLDD